MSYQDEVTENEVQWKTIVADQDIKTNFHLLKPVNPLAGKKNEQVICDICKNPATLRCISCSSNWCSHEHFLLDDEPIHMHICQKQTELRFRMYEKSHFQEGEDALARKAEKKIEQNLMLDIQSVCQTRCRGYIAERNYIMALAPALRNLGMTSQIFGTHSFEYACADLLLSKVHLGLRKYNFVHQSICQLNVEADQLIQQQLRKLNRLDVYQKDISKFVAPKKFGDNLVRFPFVMIPMDVLEKIDPEVIGLQARVQHLTGTFYQSLGERDLSIRLLTEASYYMSVCYGPTSLRVSLCYLEIAKSMLIGEKPVPLTNQPIDARLTALSAPVQRALFILDICVDIWNVAIRRQFNQMKVLQFDFCEIGEPRLLLQDTKAIAALYLGMDSYLYIKSTVTLCLLFAMYDGDYEAVIEARIAKKFIVEFKKQYSYLRREYQEVVLYEQDIKDMMSVLETPEVLRRIAQVEKDAKGRQVV